jgi:hypothetical protein
LRGHFFYKQGKNVLPHHDDSHFGKVVSFKNALMQLLLRQFSRRLFLLGFDWCSDESGSLVFASHKNLYCSWKIALSVRTFTDAYITFGVRCFRASVVIAGLPVVYSARLYEMNRDFRQSGTSF